jgi:hypothetical protein
VPQRQSIALQGDTPHTTKHNHHQMFAVGKLLSQKRTVTMIPKSKRVNACDDTHSGNLSGVAVKSGEISREFRRIGTNENLATVVWCSGRDS